MKKLTYFLTLMFATTVLITSCEKINNTDGNKDARLRISKITYADNLAYPVIFKYNDKNQLVNILEERQYTTKLQYIIYNSENKPIQIIKKDSSNTIHNCVTTIFNIEWQNDGFIISSPNSYYSTDFYKLDTKGRIIKVTSIEHYATIDENTSYVNTMNWIGDDSLISQYKYISGTTTSSSYKFIKNNHVLSDINIALIMCIDMTLGEWDTEYQNEYCVAQFKGGGISIQASYTLNDQNYPIIQDGKFSSSLGINNDCAYF